MKKESKKVTAKKVTVRDVTPEVYGYCKEGVIYNHPEVGEIITFPQIKALFPSCVPYCKNIYRKITTGTLNLSKEEADTIGVRISGNPTLGIRVFTEKGCEELATKLPEEMQRDFLLIICCIFHKEEVRELLYPEKNTSIVKEQPTLKEPGSTDTNHALDQIGKLLLCQMDVTKAQTIELKRVADELSVIRETMQGILVLVQKSAVAAEAVAETKEENPDGKKQVEIPPLKLKRGIKDPVYKRNMAEIQTFRDDVLRDIPSVMHNSVLSYAYKRMRDVYGVPVDTYRNEYFADTGKTAKSSLEIAHWLEFHNPAIRGLLRCCVQTAMKEGVLAESAS